MGLLFRQCSFRFLSREGCDSPRHPVGKLDNIIFCPRSLVIIGEITLQPEDERHKSRFQLHSRNIKHCCNWIHGEIKRKKKQWGSIWGTGFPEKLIQRKRSLNSYSVLYICEWQNTPENSIEAADKRTGAVWFEPSGASPGSDLNSVTDNDPSVSRRSDEIHHLKVCASPHLRIHLTDLQPSTCRFDNRQNALQLVKVASAQRGMSPEGSVLLIPGSSRLCGRHPPLSDGCFITFWARCCEPRCDPVAVSKMSLMKPNAEPIMAARRKDEAC